jgi:hypothetical protein
VLARPPGSGPPPESWEPEADELQFFLNDVAGDVWICRRDARVTKPLEQISAVTPSGLPAVVPEVQLLYKAKHHLDKDERDFEATLGRLSPAQQAWLRARARSSRRPLALATRGLDDRPLIASTRAGRSLRFARPPPQGDRNAEVRTCP